MFDDNFDMYKNTPFDLNGDGHIDPGEASYIKQTLYPDDKTSNNSGGSHEASIGGIIVSILFIIACFVFASSPGIILFLAMMIFSAKISSMF